MDTAWNDRLQREGRLRIWEISGYRGFGDSGLGVWGLGFREFQGLGGCGCLRVCEGFGRGGQAWAIINPIKLETGLRPNSAGVPYILILRIEASGFPTFWLLL